MDNGYELYRSRRELWAECMDAEDGHSIWQQIWRATYNAAAYRTVNKGVELAPEAIEGGRQLNGLLYNLLTECFFEAECVRIRRLVESGRDGLDKKRRAVYSLGSLLQDMQKHAHLMTVENVCRASEERGVITRWIGKQRNHIELIAQTDESEPPHVPPSFLQSVQNRLERDTQPIRDYVNKHIAHAATPWSRAAKPADPPSFLQVMDALRSIHETAEFISVYLLDGMSHKHLPAPPEDLLAYMDRPLAPNEQIQRAMQDCWQKTDREVREWQVGFEEMLTELGVR